MKPQSGKNRTFQCRRHFDSLKVKLELGAERARRDKQDQ